MKRLIRYVALIVFIGVAASTQQIVEAHTLKVDGGIGITMHISPDDAPLSGQRSQIMVSVEDREGKFRSFSDCDCVIDIGQQDDLIESISMSGTSQVSAASYIFPASGIYKLTVKGQPNDNSDFEPFEATFTYKVSGEFMATVPEVPGNPLKNYFPFMVIFVASSLVLLFLLPVQQPKE